MAVVISDRLLDSSDRLLDAEPDEQLVSLVRSGHEAAFAAIVRRYERELQGQARRLTGDGRGEDAVQQAFLNAFAALRSGRDVRHLRGWLHQILRNEVTRARVPVDAPLEAAAAYGEPLEDTVQRRATARATLVELSALPDRQRDALLGTAVLGLPRAHVARTMGLSEGAVRQLVHRARLRLREAATALIPFPLLRFFGSARSGAGAAPDAALGAGTAVSGGLAIKVGALVASGVVATSIAVTHAFPTRHHHTASPAPGAGHHDAHARTATHPAPTAAAHAAPSAAAPIINAVRLREHSPAGAREDGRFRGRSAGLSGTRSGGRGGPGSGSGRTDGGREGSSSGRGGDGSGRPESGTAARGSAGDDSGSRSGSGSLSGSGSGSSPGGDGGGSGSGRSPSGSSGRDGSDSGPSSGSATGSGGGSGGTADTLTSDGGQSSPGGSGSNGESVTQIGSETATAPTAGSPDSPSAASTDTTSSGGSSDGGSSGSSVSGTH